MKWEIFFSLFLMSVCSVCISAERTLIIKPLSGEEQTEALANIGYIRVVSDSLLLYSQENSLLNRVAISDIRHLRFGQNAPSAITETSATLCRIYPNPTQDMLVIEHAGCEKAYIYDVAGRLLQTIVITGERTTADVSMLPQGEYLLLLQTQIVKFIKQ